MKINQRLFDHYGIDTAKDLGIESNCPRPFDTVLIDKNGSCFACECTSWLPQSLGNLQIQTLDDILNSKMAKELQSSILDGTYRYCNTRHCAWLLDKKNPPAWSRLSPEPMIRHLRLAIDDSCNLKCPSCRKSLIFHKEGSVFNLGIKLADRINDWLSKCQHPLQVHIGSDGDPFASHVYRHFMERTPKRDSIKYSILTNALMFKDYHVRVPHVVRNLEQLGVSIDGASKETYEKLRLGGKWEKALEGLEHISTLRQQHDFQFILHFVVQKHNYHEMEDVITLGRKFNADRVWLNRITDWGTYTDFISHDVASPTHAEHENFQTLFSRIKTQDNFVEYATLE
jgi:sulfatase maturation enzyme AslB (radical SAM superfamily)